MGLTEWAHGLSWWLTSFALFLWIAISATPIASGFLPKTNSSILFTYFFLFGMSAINLSFLVAVFFTNSKLAAIVGPVVLASCVLPKYIFFNTNSNQSLAMKVLASLLSPTAFTFGADVLSSYEYAEVGVQYSNLNGSGYNMNICFGMLVFDSFLYGFLAWYLDNVLPHDIGIAKHPLFFLLPSYWCGGDAEECSCCSNNHTQSIGPSPYPRQQHHQQQQHIGYHTLHGHGHGHGHDLHSDQLPPMEHAENIAAMDSKNYEEIPLELQRSVKMSLHGLWKQYPDGKVAVKGVSLDILEGQITCLLGTVSHSFIHFLYDIDLFKYYFFFVFSILPPCY